ncbi:TraR/DksA family transcriptional regulator [Allonocardiopsis opalescens]|uniref:TraR/DksA family transcriptional regulator n=1 Tax=Allonocardiopsis opalescens TaxID=1144618 RepID=A0A2T0Q3W4_9ACTN|nr:TraR/DksA C4-type zinc finger protein [Allonocardiopsis opalescens]PRX98499.1 TraR/DksA family transcriptional regulator [Allonocardiopsis opalescens]
MTHAQPISADAGPHPAAELPVRPGEEPWSEAERTEVRERLLEDIATYRAEIEQAQAQLADQLADSVSGAGDDTADTGAKNFAREHSLAVTYNTRDLLAQSERAIARMDAGTYGACESCGKAIGKARLQAYPRAVLCVQCKQREERR